MSLYLSPDTRAALGSDQQLLCENRSLFFDRFADPTLEKEERKAWFNRGRKIGVSLDAKRDRSSHFPTATVLHARLQARLMVNMAGGVMENAGLCLDRYGMPYIPGSTVKGCARRMALQALHDWCTTGTRPTGEDICTNSCQPFTSPAEMLQIIALAFGWVEQDWSTEKNRDKQDRQTTWKSDFAWACGGEDDIWNVAASNLCSRLKAKIKDPAKPWDSLPNFAGGVAFLPAYPSNDPGLELDIVTCHHGDYYSQKTDARGKLLMPVALDTEEPVPVIFPAVAAQTATDYFTFPLIPLRHAGIDILTYARTWLSAGLETFGLGAKTNAGYGWFDASEAFNEAISQQQQARAKSRKEEEEKQREAEKEAAEAKAKAEAKAALAAEFAKLTPEQQEDKRIELLTDAQFDAKVRAFCKEPRKGGPSDTEQQAIVRALRGPRLDYWQAFKPKATKGDLSTVDQSIRALNKKLHGDKMP